MKKEEWKKRCTQLRTLLTRITEHDPTQQGGHQRIVASDFGAVLHVKTQLWHVYNPRTDNIIAILKLVTLEDSPAVVIRYRKKSWYADVLKNWKPATGLEVIATPSAHIGRRSSWVRSGLSDAFMKKSVEVPYVLATSIKQAAQVANGVARDRNGRFINREEAARRIAQSERDRIAAAQRAFEASLRSQYQRPINPPGVNYVDYMNAMGIDIRVENRGV